MLEDLTSYYLETLFIPSVSCICSKNQVMLILHLHVPKPLPVFQKPSLCFQSSTRFPLYSFSWNNFTVSLSMSDHVCLHILCMHNRKHLPCIIRYPLVSMVRVCSPTSWTVAVCNYTNEEEVLIVNNTWHEHCCKPCNWFELCLSCSVATFISCIPLSAFPYAIGMQYGTFI